MVKADFSQELLMIILKTIRKICFWAYQHFNQENDAEHIFRIVTKSNPQIKSRVLNQKIKICQSLVIH